MNQAPLAIMADELGPPENYQLVHHDPGEPGPDQVRYRIKAAAVNYVDTLVAAGKYQVKPATPFIPGAECAGVVEAVGDRVSAFKPGDRVFTSAVGNAFCQAAVADQTQLFRWPESLSFAEAATFKVAYTTAYLALVTRGQLQRGESVLVLGAAGGVGYAAIQIARALGAGRIIASASSHERRQLACQAGADVAVDSRAENWREQVKAANDGKGIDIVVDTVGGEATEPAFRSLAWNGRHLIIGFAGGGIPRLPTNLALLKGASLVGVDIRQFGIYQPEEAAANTSALFQLHESHDLRPHIGHRFKMTEFAEAMALAATGQALGRIVLEMEAT